MSKPAFIVGETLQKGKTAFFSLAFFPAMIKDRKNRLDILVIFEMFIMRYSYNVQCGAVGKLRGQGSLN